jgi:hypothetical protein
MSIRIIQTPLEAAFAKVATPVASIVMKKGARSASPGAVRSHRVGDSTGAGASSVPAGRLPQGRRELLRDALPGTVDSLKRRRADLIDETDIADYVALNWLEWNGGDLRLTVTGQNICQQMAVVRQQG